MKNKIRNKRALRYLNGIKCVESTTLNPEGPGAVRIHLVPARKGKRAMPAIVVLNGWRLITLNSSWTILLSMFIREVNKFEGKEILENDLREILRKVCIRMQKIYPCHFKARFKADFNEMLGTMIAIAKGEEVKSDVSMSIIDYADKMAGPLRMDLMVSAMTKEGKWNCNQKCKICYAAGQTQAEVPELTTNDWNDILNKLWNEAYVSQVTFTGGEPTRREDLVELITMARRFVTRLNTNGLKLADKSYCQDLYDADLDSLQITFYSSDPEIHNELVGIEGGWEKTVEGIKKAIEKAFDVKVEKEEIVLAIDSMKQVDSIYEEDSENNKLALIDRVSSEKDETDTMINRIFIKELLNKMDSRDRQIIMLRYFNGKTQSQVAKMLNISQVQVSRIEKKILNKMKIELIS